MASRGAQGILLGGRVDSHSVELCKTQLVNIAPIVDTCMCNLTEKGNTGTEECKNIFRFSAHVFHMARFCIKQSSSSMSSELLRILTENTKYCFQIEKLTRHLNQSFLTLNISGELFLCTESKDASALPQQAKKGVTVLAGVIELDYQDEISLLLHKAGAGTGKASPPLKPSEGAFLRTPGDHDKCDLKFRR
ncbi:hypothetical protein AAY473_014926 [Plecturocebus cupreus]